MYSDKKNVLQLVALLKEHNISNVVLCPGSRNAPIVHSISSDCFFNVHSVTDERSAGFYAIGIYISTNKPVVVCCTSGTAVANLHSAVAEAFYQEIPLIVISADRPISWIGQMDGQTIPQQNIFKSLVKKSVSLPEIVKDEDQWYCNRLINEAILEAKFKTYGPVHINVPISEPLFNFTEKTLPKVRTINRYSEKDVNNIICSEIKSRFIKYKKIIVISGQKNEPNTYSKDIDNFLNQSAVCFSELISNKNIISNTINNFDIALLSVDQKLLNKYKPELVITFGGHITSKRLKEFIRKNKPKEHWHISPDGNIVDLYQCLTSVFEYNPYQFFNILQKQISTIDYCNKEKYIKSWKLLCNNIPKTCDVKFSGLYATESLLKSVPYNSIIHLANSSAIRYAQLCNITKNVTFYSNRGTNGIDGSLSTAIGCGNSNNKLNFIIIGDLSFFYDMNALYNNVNKNIRIMMLNNSGGSIFYTLPNIDTNLHSMKYITANNKNISAKEWVKERGFIYKKANTEKEFEQAMTTFLNKESEKPIFLEIFTNCDTDARILKNYYKTKN